MPQQFDLQPSPLKHLRKVSTEGGGGFWTPVITFQTPGDLSVTYDFQWGKYALTYLEARVRFYIVTSAFTHSTASGTLRITGLPFFTSDAETAGPLQYSGITKAGFTSFVAYAPSGQKFLTISACGSGVTSVNVQAADMPSGGTISLIGQINYIADLV